MRPALLASAVVFSALTAPLFAQNESRPVGDGANLPDIVAKAWANEPTDLHNLQGNVVLLLFWQKPTGS